MKYLLLVSVSALLLCSCGASRSTTVYRGDAPDEQINVGYGTVSSKELTYGVSQVNVNPTEVMVFSSIWDYLRGRVPGVEIGPAGPGETPSITVRGLNSINSSTEPLILVDGTEVSDLNFLHPSDVATVSVLKDAAASIYGSRGANGVIMISTKSAKIAAEQEAEFQREAREAVRAARKARKEARAARKAAKDD